MLMGFMDAVYQYNQKLFEEVNAELRAIVKRELEKMSEEELKQAKENLRELVKRNRSTKDPKETALVAEIIQTMEKVTDMDEQLKCNGKECTIKQNCRHYILHCQQEQYECGSVLAKRIESKCEKGKCCNYYALCSDLTTEELIGLLPKKIEVEGYKWELQMCIDGVRYITKQNGENLVVYVCCGESLRKMVLKTLSFLWSHGYSEIFV